MQDECLLDSSLLLVHINAAKEAAEANARVISTLQERAVLAESQIRACEAKYAQKAAEHAAVVEQLQQCQLDCDLLRQQVLALSDELEFEYAALTAEAQEREFLKNQLTAARTTIQQLEHQLALQTTCSTTGAIHAQLQHRLQDLHAQLAATNCSRQSLQQRLEEHSMLLQQQCTLPASPQVQSDVLDAQQQGGAALSHIRHQQKQQQDNLAGLCAQTTQLINTSAELAAAKAALEQQLNVSKAQLVLLHQQLTQAVAQKQQQQQQRNVHSSSSTRDRSYYKRKYHELRQKNVELEAELQLLQQQKQQLLRTQQQNGQSAHKNQEPCMGDVSKSCNNIRAANSLEASRDGCLAAAGGSGARKVALKDCTVELAQPGTAAAVSQQENTVIGAAAAAMASVMLASACKAAAAAAIATTSTTAIQDNGMPPAKRHKIAAEAAACGTTGVTTAAAVAALAENDGRGGNHPATAVGATSSAAAGGIIAANASAAVPTGSDGDDRPAAAVDVTGSDAGAGAVGNASSSESLQVTSQPEPTQVTQHVAAREQEPNSHECAQQQQWRQVQVVPAAAQAQAVSRTADRSTAPIAVPCAAAADEQVAVHGTQGSQPGSHTAAAGADAVDQDDDSEVLGQAAAAVTQDRSSSSPGDVQSSRRTAVHRNGLAPMARNGLANTECAAGTAGKVSAGAECVSAVTGDNTSTRELQSQQQDVRHTATGLQHQQRLQWGGSSAPAAGDKQVNDSRQQQQQQQQRQQQMQWVGGGAAARYNKGGDSGQQPQLRQQRQGAGGGSGSSPAWKIVRGRSREASCVTAAAAAQANNCRTKTTGSVQPFVVVEAAGQQDAVSDLDDDFVSAPSHHHHHQQQQQGVCKQKHKKKGGKAKPPSAIVVSLAAAAAAEHSAELSNDFDPCTQPLQQRKEQSKEQWQQQQGNKGQRHAISGKNNSTASSVQQVQVVLQAQQQQQQQSWSSWGRKRYMPASMQQAGNEAEHSQQQQQQLQLCQTDCPAPRAPAAAAGTSTTSNACPAAAHRQPQQQQQRQQQQDYSRTGAAHTTEVGISVAGMFPGPQLAAAEAMMPALQPKACTEPVALTGNTDVTAAAARMPAGPAAAAAAAAGPAYKYQEVVRKKADRELLPAFECDACSKFYGAIQSWGAAALQQLGLPSCGHAAPNASSAVAAAAGTEAAAGPGQQQVSAGVGVQRMVQDASRHRAKWKPPSTPVGFWDIGFTQDTVGARHLDSP